MSRAPRRSLFRRSALLLSAGACLAMSTVTLAEDPDDWSLTNANMFNFGFMNMYQGPNLELASSQLDRIADVLRLDETQREEMMALFDGLEDEHLGAWVRFAERSGDMQNLSTMSGGKTDWAEQQKKMEEISDEYQDEQDRLITLMLEDLRLMVTPEQEERWETIERERRRMKTLTAWGCFPDEQYDLVNAVGSLDLDEDEREALQPLLDEYAEELDPALVARNRQIEKVAEANETYSEVQRQQWSIDWSSETAQDDYAAMQGEVTEKSRRVIELALTARSLCERVAGLNKRYAQEIGEELSARDRRELEAMIVTSGEGAGKGFDFANYSRARQKFSMCLNMEEMIGAYSTWSSSMSGGEEWGIMRVARRMEPLTAKQINDIEALLEEFEAEMEILETKRPEPPMPPEEKMEWSFTLKTPSGGVSLMHNDPPEGAGDAGGMKFYAGATFAIAGADGGDDEMAEYMAERGDLEQRYIERLREMLTLRQRALIALQ